MKTPARICSLLCLTLAPLPALHAQQAGSSTSAPPAALPLIPPLEQKFRDGLFAEEATQDLDTAAKAYAEIIAAFDRDRATAASALFRLGEVHRKQNRPAEAIASFRRLLQEFPDREPLARLAAENLKALGAVLPEAGPGAAGANVPDISLEETQELARLQGLVKNSPDLIHSKTGGPDGKGISAFLAALRAGHFKVTEFLLANGADPNHTPEFSNPLTDAALGGHKALVELLLARGADINGAPGGDVNPVSGAIQGDAATVLKLLIERGADLKKANAVIKAVNQNKTAMLKLILDSGADPNIPEHRRRVDRNTSFWSGLDKYLGFLGGTGGRDDTSPEALTPLQAACVMKNPANAALLLEKGADVNGKSKLGSTALELAVMTSQPELAEQLLKAGADAKHIAPGGLRLTDLAAAVLHLPLYQLVRKHGAEVTGLNPAGQSIWQILAPRLKNGHTSSVDIATALLADGVEFNSLPDDSNPLVIAVRSSNIKLTKQCLTRGGDVKREGQMPLILHLLTAALERIGSKPGNNSGRASSELLTDSEIEILSALVKASADINEVYQSEEGLNMWKGLTPLHLMALHLGNVDLASLEKFLAFHPDPHLCTASSIKTPGPLRIPNELGSVMGNNPAGQRLWNYTWLENTPERSRSAWVNRPPFAAKNTGTNGAFSSMPPGNIAEVLVQHFRKSGYLPDLAKLAIHRFDPATGKTSKTEPVDVMALASQGPSSELPKLNPGDILDLPVQEIKRISTWRELPDPLPDFLRKATTRRITLTAGDWKRTFQVRPPLEGFRWDPATDILSVEPTLSSLLRFTPKPDFTYRMNAVTVKRAGQTEPQILNLVKSPESGENLTLAEGDEIILTPIPADDPGLKERLAQGIFISREKDEFLREVLRNAGAPPGIENKATVADIKGIAYLEQDWILPHPAQDWTVSGQKLAAELPLLWGATLEVPQKEETTGVPWIGDKPAIPSDLAVIKLIRRETSETFLALCRERKTYLFGQDGISAERFGQLEVGADRNHAILYLKSRSLAALANVISPDKTKRGIWELRSDRLKEPLRFDLRDKEPPFVLLENDDTLVVERDEPLLDLKQSNGAAVQPALTPEPPAPRERRRVVVPAPGK